MNTDINMNMKYPQMKSGNHENECMNTIASHMNYKTARNMFTGNNMLYMNNTMGPNLNPTMNHMNNQMSSMGNHVGGGMNSGMVAGMNIMNNNVNPNMNNQKNIYNLNKEINENIMNKNIYDINKNEKINFTNFGMKKFNNNENVNLKTNDYNKYSNTNQDNLLMNNTQIKTNFLNNDMSGMNNNLGNNMNLHTDGKIKPFVSNIMNHNVGNHSSSIMPRLNKNLNIFENAKVENPIKENVYNNIFQNTLNNNAAMGNMNTGTGNDANNTLQEMKNNMNTFMQGISGMNKTGVIPNKGIGLNTYADNIINSLNAKTKDSKLKLFDSSINKLKETEQNNMMNNPLSQNTALNNFPTNQVNNNMNNILGDNQFGQMGRIGAINKIQTFNTSNINTNMGNIHNNMNNLTNMNNANVNAVNMNNVNIMGMNPLGNAGGTNDPLMGKMTNNSNMTFSNNFGKNILLGNSNINTISNNKLMNTFNNSNVNKGISMTNIGEIPNTVANNMGNVNNEKGSLNMFHNTNNSFLNMNSQPIVNNNSLHVRDRGGAFDFMQNKQSGNDRNKMTEINQNTVGNDVTANMNQMNQMHLMNRNMNMLNNNIGNVGNTGNVTNANNMSGMNNMNMHTNRSGMHTLGMNQRGLNQMGINQIGMNYMSGVSGVNGTLGMNNMNEQGGVVNIMTMKQNESEIKTMDILDYRKEPIPNKTTDFPMNDKTQQDNISIDNYANLLKHLCTPVKSKQPAANIETFNEDMLNFEENENPNALNNEDAHTGLFKNEGVTTENTHNADMNNKSGQNNFVQEQMLIQNRNEVAAMNELQNEGINNTRPGNKEGNIYELKKLNLFAEDKKKDKEANIENKSNQIKKSKTKVFFYVNPKYILEPLKRKIYEKMSFYIENLISDIKSIENKDRSKILEELHATSWFFQVFDFDAISKLLNVFNKYLIYSDSLIIPDVLLSNKLDAEDANNAFLNGTTNIVSNRNNNTVTAANQYAENNANPYGNTNELLLMMKNKDMVTGDDYIKNFHFYFKKSEKLDLLNQKMRDYESSIIENVDKLNYMKELCKNLKSQIHLKKRTFLLLLEKAKLKNFTYKNEQLQTILNIDKKTKIEKPLALNNEYYYMFKKINEGLNILKGYSHIMVTYPNVVNEILSCESIKMYESTKSSEDGDGKKKLQIQDGEEVADSNSVNVSGVNKAKHKRKLQEHGNDDEDDAILSVHSSFEEDEEEECKELKDIGKRKKRKTIKEIKHIHKQMEDNEEWVDEFLDDF